MRDDLLKAIGSLNGMTDAIVFTHNVDFVFLQTLALRALKRSGSTRLTVLADAQCARDSYATQRPLISGLGTRYRVVPVQMAPGFRFHPKAVLLAGEVGATLFVGSGNLTFPGWRENAEVWVRFDSSTDGAAPFEQFKAFALNIIQALPLNEGIREALDSLYARGEQSWANAEAEGGESRRLVGRAGNGEALMGSMLEAMELSSGPVDEMIVCSPYFDDEGAALSKLIARVGARKTTLLYQGLGSTLTETACARNPEAELRHVSFYRQIVNLKRSRETFVHAKYYALVQGDQVIVAAGSANCSVAAMSLDGRLGNAELMAILRVPKAVFDQEWLGEMTMLEAGSPPQKREITNDEPDSHEYVKLLAARARTAGTLAIAYAPADAVIVGCLLDGKEAAFVSAARGTLAAAMHQGASSVVVVADVGGQRVQSTPFWIDDERRLRTASERNPAGESIRERAREGWSPDDWAEVVQVFTKSMAKMPAMITNGQGGGGRQGKAGQDEPEKTVYALTDLLGKDHERREGSNKTSIDIAVQHLGTKHRHSLAAMLRHWFATPEEREIDDNDSDPDDADEGPETNGNDGEESVDKPSKFAKEKVRKPVVKGATVSKPERITKLLNDIGRAMTSESFCMTRPGHLLSADLQLAAVLLGTGLRAGWIVAGQVVELTVKIWGSLFVYAGDKAQRGWLGARLDGMDTSDRAEFVDALTSPELSAALIGWAYCCSQAGEPRAKAMFDVLAAEAVARHEWIWWGGEAAEIAHELGTFAMHASPAMDREAELFDRVRENWLRLARIGTALAKIRKSIESMRYTKVQQRIQEDRQLNPIFRMEAGELMIQNSGLCVLRENTPIPNSFGLSVTWVGPQNRQEERNAILPVTAAIRVTEAMREDILGVQALDADETDELQRMLTALRHSHVKVGLSLY